MIVQRTIPPAAAPLQATNLMHGLFGIFREQAYLHNLEKELKDYFEVKHVFLVSSGKAALTVILRALKTVNPEKRRVLIPAYTCYSVPSAIVKAGLQVSLCDIEASTFDFNYHALARAVDEDTLCIVPDHLFGIAADMDRIAALCREKGIFIVEDAAQAMGGTYKGKKLGTLGDIGFFSLGRGKNITCGSGGIIVTNSDRLAVAVENVYRPLEQPGKRECLAELFMMMILSLFIRPSLYWLPAGLPFLGLGETIFYRDFPIKKFSGMKAGLLKNWKRRLEELNSIRRNNAEQLGRMTGLRERTDFSAAYLRLPILVADSMARDSIYSRAQEKGMGISRMYPGPVNKIAEIRDSFGKETYPIAAKVASQILTLPTHQFLTEKDKQDICDLLKQPSVQEDTCGNRTYSEAGFQPTDRSR